MSGKKNKTTSLVGLSSDNLTFQSRGGMATHSAVLAWETSWTEEPGGLRSMGLQESRTRLGE